MDAGRSLTCDTHHGARRWKVHKLVEQKYSCPLHPLQNTPRLVPKCAPGCEFSYFRYEEKKKRTLAKKASPSPPFQRCSLFSSHSSTQPVRNPNATNAVFLGTSKISKFRSWGIIHVLSLRGWVSISVQLNSSWFSQNHLQPYLSSRSPVFQDYLS